MLSRVLLSFGILASLSTPLFAETPAAPAPAVAAPEVAAPVVATPAVEVPKAEAPAAKVDAPEKSVEKAEEKAAKPVDEKRVGKMRDRWRKMTPEQRDEMRKKAERRLGERYDRLKPAEQTSINGIMTEIEKLNKEQRSILMAKIRQKSHKDRLQRKLMKDAEGAAKKTTPAAEPAPAAAH